jgi:hypothetical protein
VSNEKEVAGNRKIQKVTQARTKDCGLKAVLLLTKRRTTTTTTVSWLHCGMELVFKLRSITMWWMVRVKRRREVKVLLRCLRTE